MFQNMFCTHAYVAAVNASVPLCSATHLFCSAIEKDVPSRGVQLSLTVSGSSLPRIPEIPILINQILFLVVNRYFLYHLLSLIQINQILTT